MDNQCQQSPHSSGVSQMSQCLATLSLSILEGRGVQEFLPAQKAAAPKLIPWAAAALYPYAPSVSVLPTQAASSANAHVPQTRSKVRYKDLYYDGKASWKSFLMKFVKLVCSHQ